MIVDIVVCLPLIVSIKASSHIVFGSIQYLMLAIQIPSDQIPGYLKIIYNLYRNKFYSQYSVFDGIEGVCHIQHLI